MFEKLPLGVIAPFPGLDHVSTHDTHNFASTLLTFEPNTDGESLENDTMAREFSALGLS